MDALYIASLLNCEAGSNLHNSIGCQLVRIVAELETGRALLSCAGGYDRGECLRTVESYDLGTNRWSPLVSMGTPRGRVDVTVLHGHVYVIGGSDGTKELASAEVFDGAAWRPLPALGVARSNAGGWSDQLLVSRAALDF